MNPKKTIENLRKAIEIKSGIRMVIHLINIEKAYIENVFYRTEEGKTVQIKRLHLDFSGHFRDTTLWLIITGHDRLTNGYADDNIKIIGMLLNLQDASESSILEHHKEFEGKHLYMASRSLSFEEFKERFWDKGYSRRAFTLLPFPSFFKSNLTSKKKLKKSVLKIMNLSQDRVY